MASRWLGSYLLLWAFVAIQGVITFALLRAIAGIHQRLEDQQGTQIPARLAQGAVLADQELTDLSGHQIKLSRLWREGNLIILFASLDCAGCLSPLAWVGEAFRNGQLSDWDVCVLCAGSESQVRNFFRETGFPDEIPVAAVEYTSLQTQFHVFGTPTLAVVEKDGHVVQVIEGEVEPYLSILTRRSEFRVPV